MISTIPGSRNPSFWDASYSAGPLLGNLEAGVVASFAGVRATIASGGILCIAGVALAALALPAFRHYDARRAGSDSAAGNTGTRSTVRTD